MAEASLALDAAGEKILAALHPLAGFQCMKQGSNGDLA
jgi:hypothetical protein